MRTNSSGIKRGLATVAISALAVTGIPALASPASADSLVEQAATTTTVELVAPAVATASVKNDGKNTTVHLVANGGSDVQQVKFEYQPLGVGAFVEVATVSRTNGAFSAEWTVPAAIYNLPGTVVRATGLGIVGTPVGTPDTQALTASSSANALDIATAPGAGVGVFAQPYAAPNNKALGAVSGTTSDLSANPDITLSSPNTVGATALPEDFAAEVKTGDTSRAFSGAVDFTGYTFDATDPKVDEAFVYAVGGSDDAEAVSVYRQSIANVSVTSQPALVPNGSTATAVIKVVDGQGNPVAGAQVFQDDDGDNAGDGAAVFTDSKGEARFAGLTGSAAGVTHSFFVNTTGNAAYENGTDFKRSVEIKTYAPTLDTLEAKSADGAAFDDDEYAAGDITVTVKDQNGNALAGQAITAAWHVAPSATPVPAGYPKTLPATVVNTGADGKATIAFPVGEPSGTYTLKYFVNTDGTPGQGATDPTGPDLVVKAGQAALKWKDGSTAQAASGTTATFEATLALEDGTPLPGRDLSATWTKNPTGNAVVAAQGAQPAGTTRVGDAAVTAKTGQDGTFGVAIADPTATPKVDELDGRLDANTTATTGIGNAGAAAPVLDVDFLRNPGPSVAADVTISQQALVDALQTPGRPVDLDINVQNSDNVELTDFPVTVSVDHGFLSPNAETAADLKADPAPAAGGLYGEWKSEGTEKELTTDDTGNTGIVVAIEDDEAFATQEDVTTKVTVTAGTVSQTVNVVFSSENPLNGGDVRVELADEADQTVTVLPKAPTTEDVEYDVFVEDQFGNLVKGENVVLTDDLADADMNAADGTTTVQSQLADEAPVLTLSSDVAGDQTVHGTWTTEKNTWKDSLPLTPAFDAARDTVAASAVETDADAVNWYLIDFAAGEYSMTSNGTDPHPVGSTVIVTYEAVDQNGEPIQGLNVNFFRAGPDDEQDGDNDSAVVTNADGVSQYVFQGIKAGTAIVDAVVRNGSTIVPEANLNHTVTFGAEKSSINARLSGKSKRGKDVLKVRAPRAAAGASVELYAKRGKRVVKVAEGTLNRNGVWTKRVKDRNKNRKTAYAAIVRETGNTLEDTTNVRRVR